MSFAESLLVRHLQESDGKNADHTYTGPLDCNGLASGQGECVYLEGELKGNVYKGDLVRGLRHGHGILRYANGDVYEGDFFNDTITGRGTKHWNNGDWFEGEVQNDNKSGTGTYYINDGPRYTGRWEKDQPNGKGTYFYANGDCYRGHWKDWAQHGQGILYIAAEGSWTLTFWDDGKQDHSRTVEDIAEVLMFAKIFSGYTIVEPSFHSLTRKELRSGCKT